VAASIGLNDEGVHLLADYTALVGRDAALIGQLIADGSDGWCWQGGNLLESDEILNQNRRTYRLGLNPTLLDLAESYLGEPCFYMGCSLKREEVDPFIGGTRQWHLDIEDDRMLRIIIYLNDVQDGGGPFQYIDAARSRLARSRLDYQSGYLSDAAMRSAVSEDRWASAYGRAGLIVAFDGTRVFHRVARPEVASRFSLSLTYTSRYPRHVFRQVRLRSSSFRAVYPNLSERERACLPTPRWF
jgi:hypothetical protein